jgi:alpha 1,3-glucosidase
VNEPAIFDTQEQTFPKDTIHVDGRENREVHNAYGLAYTMSTAYGLNNRNAAERLRFFCCWYIQE